MSPSIGPDTPPAESLCLACGLCCNGVLFADVELRPGDEPKRLRSLGLRFPSFRRSQPENDSQPEGTVKFLQPCAALDGCGRCRIYAQRPKYCEEFECLLLKSVKAGSTRSAAALSIIRTARQRANKVRRLLNELGDSEEAAPLSARFRRSAKRLEKGALDEATAETYGELTLAVHDLNFLLSQAFYPGESTQPV